MLANLLTNAMKFGAGKPISVTVSREGDHARLTVGDRGPGISAADQARIFDRFYRAVSAEHFGGLGLGLHIGKGIVQSHGGDIGVESEPGHGALFVVQLPYRAANALAEARA